MTKVKLGNKDLYLIEEGVVQITPSEVENLLITVAKRNAETVVISKEEHDGLDWFCVSTVEWEKI